MILRIPLTNLIIALIVSTGLGLAGSAALTEAISVVYPIDFMAGLILFYGACLVAVVMMFANAERAH